MLLRCVICFLLPVPHDNQADGERGLEQPPAAGRCLQNREHISDIFTVTLVIKGQLSQTNCLLAARAALGVTTDMTHRAVCLSHNHHIPFVSSAEKEVCYEE